MQATNNYFVVGRSKTSAGVYIFFDDRDEEAVNRALNNAEAVAYKNQSKIVLWALKGELPGLVGPDVWCCWDKRSLAPSFAGQILYPHEA